MTVARITPILFLMAALAWAVAGMITAGGENPNFYYFGVSAMFAALSLIYFRKSRSKGEGQNG